MLSRMLGHAELAVWQLLHHGGLWRTLQPRSPLLPGRVLHLQHFVARVTADERLVLEGVHGLRGLDFPEQRRL